MKKRELRVGMSAAFCREVTIGDIHQMAEISGDYNPIHINEDYAKATPFGGVIAHGLFGVGMISALLGNVLPGDGTIILSEEIRFRKPIYAGDHITASVVISEIAYERKRVSLTAICTNQRGETVLEGSVLTKYPPLQ